VVKKDSTASTRMANMDARRRAAGLVPVSTKVWVPEDSKNESSEILRKAKMQIEKMFPI